MNLQPLKIPRGYRGDWPVQEYALIDAVESVITEVELARGSNASLAAELEETYATKSYVQLAIASPSPGDIYVSDLSVKLSEESLVGYSLQVNAVGNLQFRNTYSLDNGTLSNPSIYFNNGVDAGLYVNYSGTNEDFNIKVASGIIAKFSHNKISGENNLIFGNVDISSGGLVTGVSDLSDIRSVKATGTGGYKSEFAEVSIGLAGVGTLNVTGNTTLHAVSRNLSTSVLSGGFDVDSLKTITKEYMCTGCINTPEELGPGFPSDGMLSVYAGAGSYLDGKAIQIFLSFTTTTLCIRYWSGSAWNSWRVLSKETGNQSVPFYVGEATADNHAMRKVDVENAISAITPPSVYMPVVAAAKLENTAGSTVQYLLLANVTSVTRVSFGWDVTFNSPVTDEYIVVGNVSSYSANSFTFEPTNLTSTGFHIHSVSSTAPASAPPDGAELHFIVHSL